MRVLKTLNPLPFVAFAALVGSLVAFAWALNQNRNPHRGYQSVAGACAAWQPLLAANYYADLYQFPDSLRLEILRKAQICLDYDQTYVLDAQLAQSLALLKLSRGARLH